MRVGISGKGGVGKTTILLAADRTHRLAVELGITDIAFVGNRADDGDRQRLENFAAERGRELAVLIPDDAVLEPDRRALCLLDRATGSLAVTAIERLADVVEACDLQRTAP